MLTPTVPKKAHEPMTMTLRGGGEGEDICCGLYVEFCVVFGKIQETDANVMDGKQLRRPRLL